MTPHSSEQRPVGSGGARSADGARRENQHSYDDTDSRVN